MIKVNYDEKTGEILGFYPNFIQYANIPEPTIEINETTHQDCIQNPGLRRVDLSALKIVEHNPTTVEVEIMKLASLDAEYQPQFAALAQALGLATLAANQTTIDGVKEDYAALTAEYNTKREVITGGD